MTCPLPHAYIISLLEDQPRRERLSQSLNKIGMSYSLIEGIDGREFDVQSHPSYDVKKRHRYFGRDLLGGELGCLLSHKKALETLVNSSHPYAVIFEDDAVIGEYFASCISAISALEPVPDLVRFIGKDKIYKTKHKIIKNLGNNINLTRTRGVPGGAYAYFISKEGAIKLLKHLQKIYIPVDTIIGHAWETGIDNLITIPSPVTHAKIEDSNIGDERFNKTIILSGIDKHLYPIFRGFYKLKETMMKRIYFMVKNSSN